MSPKFYSFLWVVYFVVAAVLWLAGVFTLLTAVVFGFVAFGFVFTGMMCVLPSTVSHKHEGKQKPSADRGMTTKAKAAPSLTSYRSA